MGRQPSATHRVARRDVLRSGSLAFLVAASACDLSTSPNSTNRPGAGPPTNAKEAPALAGQVKAGKLPPLHARLPEHPLVLQQVDKRGVYGGQWDGLLTSTADVGHLYLEILNDKLMSWDLSAKPPKPTPNIAEALEVEGDGRSYILTLRKGMRWSNGEPFTADDIVFSYNDVARDQDLSGGVVPAMFTVSPKLPELGDPPRLTKVDDHTVKFEFAQPFGPLSGLVATPFSVELIRPRHYLEKFHKKFNKNVDQLAKKGHYSNWMSLFWAKADLTANVDLPTVNAWRVTTALGDGARLVAERNPYYWKTDSDGRQLPYVDRVVYQVLSGPDTVLLKTSNGEADFDMWRMPTAHNKPVLARNRDRGGYHFINSRYSSANQDLISLNFTHQDPKVREVFQNKDFRIGLSHAINRREIINAIFQRQGQPWQVAPRPESALFDDTVAELGKQYIEYDVDLANKYLDRGGYHRRDSSGVRLRPDGHRISFAIDVVVPDQEGSYWADVTQFVVGYWQKVGIDVRVRTMDRSLFYTRKAANKHDASIWLDSQGMDESVFDPRNYFPSSSESNYAIPWANWFNGAQPAEEPPDAPRRQMELYNQLKATVSEAKRQELFHEILRIAKEQFYVIGIVLPPMGYAIVKNDFHNTPNPMMRSWIYAWSGPDRPAQYFMSS